MKLKSNLASITFAATLVLQASKLVTATPLFNLPTTAPHLNDASIQDICEDFRITYPASEGISFDDNSKHIIAWNAPESMKQVNITLISNQDPSTAAYVGNFDAQKGATQKEIEFSLQGRQAGDYHLHISGQAENSQYCEVDSVTFKINNAAASTTTSAEQETSNNSSTINQTELDTILEQIHNSDSSLHENDANWESALDEVTALTKEDEQNKHSNSADVNNSSESSSPFKDYINSMDLEYEKYIHKNKETETEAVTHKNDANPYFTNEDSIPADRKWHSNDDNPYFTNTDLRTNIHTNDAEWVEEPEHANSWESSDPYVEPVTHANDAEWVDGDGHTNSWESSDPYVEPVSHSNDAEWIEENNTHGNEGWTSEHIDMEYPTHANDAEWEADNTEGHNDSEWTSEHVDMEYPTHANDAEWEGDNTHDNEGWTSEHVDMEYPTHANDAEWESDNTEGHNDSEWTSEHVDMEYPTHANDAEWEGDNTHDNEGWTSEHADVETPIHSNSAEWTEDGKHTNDGWISEHVDVDYA
ncbi:hypothetical protein G6F16_003394 [Rhizopus arrhizus]|nr:hypothetical protein G6F20_000364 [Rhizopus arrhizus]KAG0838299.1 hypothetical protein G6F19_003202 [Rhizopus arrhizus]KAG0844895.1 hypothetical protein G6F18_001457 [Rhizopus arrhizus]KAG0874945.1 hypothetical protein G6F16_003394 [Rhizopus arrhizus]KAG0888312.1 hypothetical protein G6F15_001675 [Rhizopus arrhizus]